MVKGEQVRPDNISVQSRIVANLSIFFHPHILKTLPLYIIQLKLLYRMSTAPIPLVPLGKHEQNFREHHQKRCYLSSGIRIYICIYIYIHMYICTNTDTHMCVYVCVCARVRASKT